MHIEVQVTSTVVQLGTLSNEASLIAKKVKNSSENGYFEDFRLGQLVVHFEAIWTSTWAELVPCAILEPSWAEVGPSVSKLGPCWFVAAMSDRNGAFGRCCACAIFGGLSWANMAPTQS